jgi:hypothetical protein
VESQQMLKHNQRKQIPEWQHRPKNQREVLTQKHLHSNK